MIVKPIRTEEDYNAAMARLDIIFDAIPGTPEDDELAILSVLIDNYEKIHYPIGLPDPIEAIKFRMEQLNYTQSDLANILGIKSRASEILNRKRKLSLDMIRKLHSKLKISTEVLIQSY